MSCLERCPYYRGVLIEGFHHIWVQEYCGTRNSAVQGSVVSMTAVRNYSVLPATGGYCSVHDGSLGCKDR